MENKLEFLMLILSHSFKHVVVAQCFCPSQDHVSNRRLLHAPIRPDKQFCGTWLSGHINRDGLITTRYAFLWLIKTKYDLLQLSQHGELLAPELIYILYIDVSSLFPFYCGGPFLICPVTVLNVCGSLCLTI